MLKKSILLLLTVPFSALSGPAQPDYNKMYDQCLSEAGAINNGAVAACANGVSEEVKAEISAQYKNVYDRLVSDSSKDAAKFERAQNSWLVYRNVHCDLAGEYIGSPMYYFCPMQLNIQRVKELRELSGE